MRLWRFRSRDLAEEMRFHRDQLEAEGRTSGEASRAFGNELLLRQRSRDAWGWLWLEALGRDLRLAARQMRRAPGFTAAAVLTLALGIGANTAVFTVMGAVLLRPLPVPNPAQLTLLYWTSPHLPFDLDNSGTNDGLPPIASGGNEMYSLAYPDFVQLRQAAAPLVSAVFGFAPLDTPNTTVVVDGDASLARATVVTQDYFPGLQVSPALGRLLSASDFQPGAPLAAVISDAYWTRRFGRAPAAIGRAISVDRRPAVIVGVAPPSFHGLETDVADDLWLPAAPANGLLPWGNYQPSSGPVYLTRLYWWLQVMVRRRSGVSEPQLRAVLAPRFNALAIEDVRTIMRPGDQVPQLRTIAGAQGISSLAELYGPTLRVLMASAGLLLLLACINLAALLLARASSRRREIGVRPGPG
ncbi:MAG: ABC transporter permease [Terriglobales bacterium]